MSETEITAWLADQQTAMVALLREMVDIDSGSYNKSGIDAVGLIVRRFLESHGLTVEAIPQSRHGDCLRASIPGQAAGNVTVSNSAGNILLMGHRDTVFPDGETTRRPFTIRDGIAYGPGVADM
jgi:glutamate carboxypeptidase